MNREQMTAHLILKGWQPGERPYFLYDGVRVVQEFGGAIETGRVNEPPFWEAMIGTWAEIPDDEFWPLANCALTLD